MEELVTILLQVFFELLFQMLGSSGISWAAHNKLDRGCAVLSFHIFIGGLLGWISTLIAPKLLLPHPALRIGNLIVSPLLAAALSYGISKWARSNGHNWDPESHAIQGFCFAFFFGVARFLCGTHP